MVEQTSPFGRVTTYTYQVPGATVIADDRGVRQAMVHDGRGNLTAVVDVDGSAMRITYDDADRAVRVVSKSGAEWRYDFDDDTGDLLHPPRSRRTPAVVDVGRTRPAAHRHRPRRRHHDVRVRRRSAHPGARRRARREHRDRRARPRRTARHDHRRRRCGPPSRMGHRWSAHEDHRRGRCRDHLRVRCRRSARPPRRPRGYRHARSQYEHGRVSRSVRGDAVCDVPAHAGRADQRRHRTGRPAVDGHVRAARRNRVDHRCDGFDGAVPVRLAR